MGVSWWDWGLVMLEIWQNGVGKDLFGAVG